MRDETKCSRHRHAETSFKSMRSVTAGSFLSHLTTAFEADATNAQFDRIRMKTILFLGASSKYDFDRVKKRLDDLEMKGNRGLAYERSIVYGKVSSGERGRRACHGLTDPGTFIAAPRQASVVVACPQSRRRGLCRNILSAGR